MRCAACGSSDRVRVFAVAVNGELLRLQVPLCGDHGDRYLLLAGELLGRLVAGRLDAPEEGKPRS